MHPAAIGSGYAPSLARYTQYKFDYVHVTLSLIGGADSQTTCAVGYTHEGRGLAIPTYIGVCGLPGVSFSTIKAQTLTVPVSGVHSCRPKDASDVATTMFIAIPDSMDLDTKVSVTVDSSVVFYNRLSYDLLQNPFANGHVAIVSHTLFGGVGVLTSIIDYLGPGWYMARTAMHSDTDSIYFGEVFIAEEPNSYYALTSATTSVMQLYQRFRAHGNTISTQYIDTTGSYNAVGVKYLPESTVVGKVLGPVMALEPDSMERIEPE